MKQFAIFAILIMITMSIQVYLLMDCISVQKAFLFAFFNFILVALCIMLHYWGKAHQE